MIKSRIGKRRKILKIIQDHVFANNPDCFRSCDIYEKNREELNKLGVTERNFGILLGRMYVRFNYKKCGTGNMIEYKKQTKALF